MNKLSTKKSIGQFPRVSQLRGIFNDTCISLHLSVELQGTSSILFYFAPRESAQRASCDQLWSSDYPYKAGLGCRKAVLLKNR